MSDPRTPPHTSDAADPILEGWKAIAAYLNRDVRTAKRWEASEGLPIHRHRHVARSSVYAHPRELEALRNIARSRAPSLHSIESQTSRPMILVSKKRLPSRMNAGLVPATFCLSTVARAAGCRACGRPHRA
jgi:hypothetical protein